MPEVVEKKYRIAELSNHSQVTLLHLLKENWGYSMDQPFEVIGCLSKINDSFFVLENLHNPYNGNLLKYPLLETYVLHNVFVGPLNEDQLGVKPVDKLWVKTRVSLSPEEEREKRGNPFTLQSFGELQLLQPLPKGDENTKYAIEGQNYIEKRIFDYYQEKHRSQIIEDGEQLSRQLHQQVGELKNQASIVETEIKKLHNTKITQEESLQEAKRLLADTLEVHVKEEADFTRRKAVMENQLNNLQQFIEQKANLLLELDLIGQEEAEKLLDIAPKGQVREGHDFEKIFTGDIKQAISYVQAFMYKKGIVYSRETLEDFFALLTTHDLIILAGDSGSGKTNLVKSFADAIGAKAIVIPVKPNWTSAEDLLGYYNPLEQKYLSTPFLDALFEAVQNPDIPYFICLDEMNLARVEYYFADFLSLMEERGKPPEICLYSSSESTHIISETRNFLSLIDATKGQLDKPDLVSFLDLLRDQEMNTKLHELCGFGEGDSLLKYHAHLRKLISSYLNTPSSVRLPPNVRIIGAINVDETTHYLSPKILDRSHIMRFSSPLLADWSKIEAEVEAFDLDLSLPILLGATGLGERNQYPEFDRTNPLVGALIFLVREFLDPLGIEFGLRTVRQAHNYSNALEQFGANEEQILNGIVLHKILPKLMFDGEKTVSGTIARKDILVGMRDHLKQKLTRLQGVDSKDTCVDELDRVINNAKANDWVVNYWSR